MVDGHCIRTIHAETNAIIQAALHGVSTKGATCYVTHLPCINCTKALINAGIVRLVYSIAYRTDENAMNFLKAANIEICQNEFDIKAPAGAEKLKLSKNADSFECVRFPAHSADGEFFYFKINSFCPALNNSAPVSVTSTSSSNPTYP